MTRFSQKAGTRRDNLYRTFNGELKPPFATVLKVLIALDMQFSVKPIRRPVEIGLKVRK